MGGISPGQTIAIIPARAGSKSVEDKNIVPLCGYPLLAYSIAAARLSHHIDRVIISTNSRDYAEIAESYGAEVPFLRPGELSTDLSTDTDFMIHAMQWFLDHEGEAPEYWVHLRPTTPLRDPLVVDEAITMLAGDGDATCLRSAHKAPESPLKWFRKSGRYFSGLTDALSDFEALNKPKESFEDIYIPDGYVDVVRASHVLEKRTIHGDAILGFISPVCTEVDSPEELEFLDFQLRRDGSPLLDFLRQHYPEDAN